MSQCLYVGRYLMHPGKLESSADASSTDSTRSEIQWDEMEVVEGA